MATNEIPLDKIRIDGGTQSRQSIDYEYVGELAQNVDDLPPGVVFLDGADYWLADGFHRFHGHKKAKRKTMTCEVRTGTKRDAILFSVGANTSHGLRRTNADKRRAVETVLSDKEWEQWSDRKIADACGVGAPFVADMRKAICNPITDSTQRKVERNGTTYNMNTAKIGRSATEEGAEVAPPQDEFDPADGFEDAAPVAITAPSDTPLPGVQAFDQCLSLLTQVTKAVNELAGDGKKNSPEKGGELLSHHLQEFQTHLKNARNIITACRPHAVCPYCAVRGGQCRACKQTRWVCRDTYEASPPEMRAVVTGRAA